MGLFGSWEEEQVVVACCRLDCLVLVLVSDESSSSDSDSDSQDEEHREKKLKSKTKRASMELFKQGWQYKSSLMGVELMSDRRKGQKCYTQVVL